MALEIVELMNPHDLVSDLLRQRAINARWPNSVQYLATLEGREVGYLSFDHRRDIDAGIIYEIVVLHEFQNRGVGSALLAHGESVAADLGCQNVVLAPVAVEAGLSEAQLRKWYTRRGYRNRDQSSEMEKCIIET